MSRSRLLLCCLLGLMIDLVPRAVLAVDPAALAAVDALEHVFTDVIAETEKSVVSVARDRVPPARAADQFELDGFPQRPNPRNEPQNVTNPNYIPSEFGAGVIVHEDGLILTSYHLVRGGPVVGRNSPADQILYVRLADRRGFPARIHAADPRSDLAVLKIEAPDKLPPIRRPANPAVLRKGQLVVALGNPYAIARDGSASASWGMISNISRRPAPVAESRDDEESRRKETIHHLGTLLHLDLRLNLGGSGGALVNTRGELIGLTTSLAAIAGYEKSAGFAVPLDATTDRILKSLIEGHEVEYGFLGIDLQDVSVAEIDVLQRQFQQGGGARVRSVIANSPAVRAGLFGNDVILAVNRRPVLSHVDLMREIGLLAPGDLAELRVWRPGEAVDRTVSVELGKWPVQDDEGIVASRPRYEPFRGLTVDYPTARFRHLRLEFRGVDLPAGGVLVTEVQPGSPAAAAELQPGDFITHVNRQPVVKPAQFQARVADLGTADALLSLSNGRTVVLKPAGK